MNKNIDFTREGGFPFTQDTLNFMQDGTKSILQTIISYLGVPTSGYYIISGVQTSGTNLTAGWVVIDGEVLPFIQGTKGNTPKIAIRESRGAVDFQNLPNQEVYVERWAEVSQTQGQALTSFSRIKQPTDFLPRDGSLPMTGAIKGHVSGGALRVQSASGYVDIGSQNNDYSHISTDRPAHYFNKPIKVNGDIGLYTKNSYIRFSDGAVVEQGAKLADKYLGKTAKAVDSAKLNGVADNTGAVANNIAKRDSAADIWCRLLRSTYQTQGSIPSGATVTMRTSTADNYLRHVTNAGFRAWIGNNSRITSDLNTVLAAGTYGLSGTHANEPFPSNYGVLEVLKNLDVTMQRLYSRHGKIAVRWRTSSSWSNWEIYLKSSSDDTFLGKLSVGSTGKRSAGIYGVYDSTKIGHIWSMGTEYKIPDSGVNFGNLYGFGYKHTNNPTGGTMAGGHQAVWCDNGSPKVALGSSGVWTSGDVKANGSGYYGDGKKIVDFNDSWLRLNPGKHFSSGIFCDSSVLRTDGQLEVGSSGGSFKANSSGAWVKGKPVMTYLRKARYYLGNPGTDQSYTISFPSVGTTNYFVIGNLQTNDGNFNNSNDVILTIGTKSTTSFRVYLREFANASQQMYFDYAIIPF